MRRPLDAYMTPEWQTAALLQRVPIVGEILEPCSGDRAIVNVLERDPRNWIYTNDIDLSCDTDLHLDATQWDAWDHGMCSADGMQSPYWVVTNPPFLSAFQILRHAQRHATKGVAMLLRISFIEPTKERGEWLEAHPPDTQIVLPRWSYIGNGKSDSTTTAWFVWFNDEAMREKHRGIFVHKDKPRPTRRERVIIPTEVSCGLD